MGNQEKLKPTIISGGMKGKTEETETVDVMRYAEMFQQYLVEPDNLHVLAALSIVNTAFVMDMNRYEDEGRHDMMEQTLSAAENFYHQLFDVYEGNEELSVMIHANWGRLPDIFWYIDQEYCCQLVDIAQNIYQHSLLPAQREDICRIAGYLLSFHSDIFTLYHDEDGDNTLTIPGDQTSCNFFGRDIKFWEGDEYSLEDHVMAYVTLFFQTCGLMMIGREGNGRYVVGGIAYNGTTVSLVSAAEMKSLGEVSPELGTVRFEQVKFAPVNSTKYW